MDQLWDSTVAALARAPVEPEAWAEAVEGVTRLSGARVGNILALGGPGWLQANWLCGVPEDAGPVMIAAGMADPAHNPRIGAGLSTSVGRVFGDQQALKGRERARFPLYRVLDELDCGFADLAVLHREEGLVVAFAIGSHSRHETGRGHDLQRFARLTSLASQAIRLQVRLERDGAKLLARRLAGLATAALVFGLDGRLLAATAEADKLLADGDRLRLVDGRLRARFAPDDLRLTEALARAGAGREEAFSLLVRDADGARPLMLDVAGWSRSAHALGFEPTVLVTVRHDGVAASRGAAAVGAAFGFTRSETAVAKALALGGSPETVAAERGVAVSTVRTQLRSLYAKAGVTRQAEMVALVLGREPAPEV